MNLIVQTAHIASLLTSADRSMKQHIFHVSSPDLCKRHLAVAFYQMSNIHVVLDTEILTHSAQQTSLILC